MHKWHARAHDDGRLMIEAVQSVVENREGAATLFTSAEMAKLDSSRSIMVPNGAPPNVTTITVVVRALDSEAWDALTDLLESFHNILRASDGDSNNPITWCENAWVARVLQLSAIALKLHRRCSDFKKIDRSRLSLVCCAPLPIRCEGLAVVARRVRKVLHKYGPRSGCGAWEEGEVLPSASILYLATQNLFVRGARQAASSSFPLASYVVPQLRACPHGHGDRPSLCRRKT